jgi:hypothetical protein
MMSNLQVFTGYQSTLKQSAMRLKCHVFGNFNSQLLRTGLSTRREPDLDTIHCFSMSDKAIYHSS